ncbi:polynucleotide adenylyltransferase family protein [Tanacetum coccineum]
MDGGFEAYLVGGCVRDLILNRIPKDFDVITTVDLHQVKKQFHRCIIIGRRFPICRVSIKGSVIEVSSFKTLAKYSEDKERFLQSQMQKGRDNLFILLRFCRSILFFDPLNFKIYDYNIAMKDLLDLKRTVVLICPILFSKNSTWTENCCSLSFSKDTEAAIHRQAPSILILAMENNGGRLYVALYGKRHNEIMCHTPEMKLRILQLKYGHMTITMINRAMMKPSCVMTTAKSCIANRANPSSASDAS